MQDRPYYRVIFGCSLIVRKCIVNLQYIENRKCTVLLLTYDRYSKKKSKGLKVHAWCRPCVRLKRTGISRKGLAFIDDQWHLPHSADFHVIVLFRQRVGMDVSHTRDHCQSTAMQDCYNQAWKNTSCERLSVKEHLVWTIERERTPRMNNWAWKNASCERLNVKARCVIFTHSVISRPMWKGL